MLSERSCMMLTCFSVLPPRLTEGSESDVVLNPTDMEDLRICSTYVRSTRF